MTLGLTFLSCILSIHLVLIIKTLIMKSNFNIFDLSLAISIPISIVPLVSFFLLKQIYHLNCSKHKTEKLIYVDTLTEVYNRRYFDSFASNIFSQDVQASIIMVDIDDFKEINDQYGHQAGDCVMKEVAKSIQCDLRDSDVIARIGGDEFAIICMKANPVCVSEIAERIRWKIANTRFMYMSHKISITVSIGCISNQDASLVTFDELLRQVDTALYQSKDNGKNLVTSVHCA